MKRYLRQYVWLTALLLAGCGDGEEIDLLTMLEDERAAIREYLAGVEPPVRTVPKYSRYGQVIDSLYLFEFTESAEKPAHDDFLLLDYSQMRLDSTYDDSTFPNRVVVDSLYVNGGPIYHHVSDSSGYDYYADAARAIGANDTRCKMLVPSQLTDQSGIARVWELRFYRIIEDLEAYEQELMAAYREQLAPETVETFEDVQGDTVTTYTVVTKEATGDRVIVAGDTITFSYTVHILDEVHMADSLRMTSNPGTQTMIFSAYARETPVGYLLGMQHLREGNEAEIIIPWAMAYGTSGQRTANGQRWRIPPYSTLVYRVKIDRVAAAPAAEEPTE